MASDLDYFKFAANTYQNQQQQQMQYLQAMAQQEARDRLLTMQQEEAERKNREMEREAYAKWEREQIMNQVASERMQDLLKPVQTNLGIKDSKGNYLYREESPDANKVAMEFNKYAAQEALRRGKLDFANELITNYQKMVSVEDARKQAKTQQDLLDEKLAQAKRESTSPDVIQSTNDAGDVTLIDKNTGNVLKTIKGAGKPSAAYEKAQQESDEGQADLEDAITTLRGYYDTLDEQGAIVNPDRGALSNIGAAIGASAPGQMIGGMIGTQAQTIRDSINMQRPLLLQAIKNATGMTAKQMDSNAELKLWLSSATDPTLSVQANRAAIDSIERKYLKKPMKEATSESQKQTTAPAAAINYLKEHPETRNQFKAKFGYLPEGM